MVMQPQRVSPRISKDASRRATGVVWAILFVVAGGWAAGGLQASGLEASGLRGPDPVARQRGADTGQDDNQLIEISGRVSPELIPDYLVWEQLFRILVRQSLQPWPDAGSPLLNLSMVERQRVWVEAEASVAREAACEGRLIDEFDALRAAGADDEVIAKSTRDVVIGCRLATLEAVDAMMGDLSESARFSLSAWAIDHRSGMTVVLLARDLAFFRQPR